MPDYALMNQYLYEGKAKEVEQMTKDALAEGRTVQEVKERVGDRMCLMGNVNPLEVGVRGTPEEVKEATHDALEHGAADGKGMILSVGGGTSPGMPRENILAMLEALEEFNSKKFSQV